MNWKTIAKVLTIIAGVGAILGGAGQLIKAVVPGANDLPLANQAELARIAAAVVKKKNHGE